MTNLTRGVQHGAKIHSTGTNDIVAPLVGSR